MDSFTDQLTCTAASRALISASMVAAVCQDELSHCKQLCFNDADCQKQSKDKHGVLPSVAA